MVKVCTSCNTSKPIDKFAKKNTARDGRMSMCKECRNGRYRVIRHCLDCGTEMTIGSKAKRCLNCSPSYNIEYKRKKKVEYKKWIGAKGCSSCDEDHPDCLEVHHLYKGAKRYKRSQGSSYNIEDIELGCAIVLCASCHLLFHQHFGGRNAPFPDQTKESTVAIIKLMRAKRGYSHPS